LNGFVRGEEFFRGRMMKQGMKVAQIERVIQAVPCILKQGLSLDEARKFEGVFRDAGGIVQVRKEGEPAPLLPVEPPRSTSRPHDFPATVDEQLGNGMRGIARLHGGSVGEAEVYQILDGYARQAHVKVAVSHVRAGFAEIHQAPGGGMCTGVMPSMAESMPPG